MSTIPRNTEFNRNKVIAFIATVFLVPLIVLLIWLYDHYLIAFLIFLIIFILVIAALITRIVKLISRKRKQKNHVRIEQQILRNYQEVNENTRELIFDGRDQLTLSQETQAKEKLSIKLLPYSYKGNIENQICMITKNPFKQNDKIIQCPICLSLYQEKYLIDWLIRKNICSVCGEKSFQIK
ncbi:MAG TPA: hypothetical protein VMZ29_02065 [Candidatus Bathyarchaeia archaeon]|nr:hypothetical protein [Candidatus Bathyarchaeia archaeon]